MDAFQVLAAFLERFGTEAEGRQLPELGSEANQKLRQLAEGKLPEADRTELLDDLSRNPELIARLAEEIKARRQRVG